MCTEVARPVPMTTDETHKEFAVNVPFAPRQRVVNILDRKVGQFAHQTPAELPTDAAGLQALLDSAQADINLIQARRAAGETLTGADRDRLRELVNDYRTIDTAHSAAVEAEAAGQPVDDAEIDGLLAEVNGQVAQGQEINDETTPPVEGTEPPPAGSDGTQPPAASAPEGTPAEQREVVTAGAGTTGGNRPVNFAPAAAGSTPPPANEGGEPGWQLHPGAPGFQEGMGRVGFAQIAQSLDSIRPGSRARVRPNRSNRMLGGEEFARQVVSTLQRDVQVVDDPHALVAAINAATSLVNGQRVTADSLTAAGGWCAPSEQLYDFCDVPDATDLLSMPEVTINRGGVRWPREPDLSGIFEDFEWFFTEPELEAVDPDTGQPTAVKHCVEVPCPEDFDEIRLNAVGWCVEAGILQEQGWPELIEWFMRSLTQEHLRALSRRSILNIVAGSGPAKVIPPTSVMGSVASVLNSLALVATNIRLKRGLSRTATIEGIAPSWFFEVLRADLAFREGTDTFAVTDAQILAWLTARNIALQFVGDWQTRSVGLPGHMDTLVWPETVDIVMYPAGTWFRSMSNVIELGVMYPKEQLQVNRFTRMFTEDAIAVGKRCGESALIRVPLNVSGAIGQRVAATNVTP
ncbi:major head protein [Mycobacterium phage 39HC]|uniref:major head protein n=1 Tax=Mycobacterium phage 39HC TaxID=1463809 RepID=UPI0003F1FDBD|nr:major head protein [Mycobacterium phage 39HC]AHJ88310.1 capsid protein [Mycobacterium phage 39HC]AHJ88410.1 structural protein [Mycobacterium phage 40BC]